MALLVQRVLTSSACMRPHWIPISIRNLLKHLAQEKNNGWRLKNWYFIARNVNAVSKSI